MSPRETDRSGERLAWPALALWVALELLVLRGLLRAATGLGLGWGARATLWDLGQDLAVLLACALTAALLATAPRPAARGLRRTVWLAAAALFVAWVLGGSLERPHARLWTPAHATAVRLAGVLLVSVALALDLERRARRPRPWVAPFGGLRGIALPTLVGLALLAAFASAFLLHPPERRATELVRELFADPARWNVTRAHPDAAAAPRVAMIAPVFRSSQARPAIVMAPPCEIRFAIGPEDGPCRLIGEAGVHVTFANAVGEGPVTVTFEALVNDTSVFTAAVPVQQDPAAESRRWFPLQERDGQSERGIALRPGDVLTLRTELVGALPEDLAPGRIELGFGQLQLVRDRAAAWEPATPERPNVVLIVQDTQRADRLGCYGCERPLTPHLDALAARGRLYEEAFAASSWTWPATATLLTGLWPEEHGVTSNQSCYLPGSAETLAEVLSARGWVTAAFTGNSLLVPPQNFNQGFDHFDSADEFRKSDAIVPAVEDWIREHAPARFFLYLHLVDPHEPHVWLPEVAERLQLAVPPDLPGSGNGNGDVDPQQAFNLYTKSLLDPAHYDADGNLLPEYALPGAHARFLSDAYDASVATGDHWIGRVLATLTDLGLDERTLVVFTSDHGEELLDHGRLAHGHTLHRELVRVPLIVAGPGVPAGERSPAPVSNRAVFDTLAGLAGARPAGAENLLRPGGGATGRVWFSTEKGWWNGHKMQRLYGLRSERWALHWAATGTDWGAEPNPADEDRGQHRLYESAVDPDERIDASERAPDVRDTLFAELTGILRDARLRRTGPAIGAGDVIEDDLRALGYIDGREDDE